MERNGIGRDLEILKLDGKKWNCKKPGKLKNTHTYFAHILEGGPEIF